MTLGEAVLMLTIGFWWSQWLAERRAEKLRETNNSAFKLVYGMVKEILEKRKFIGRAMTVIRSEKFEVQGEKFTLSLHSEGDRLAPETEDA